MKSMIFGGKCYIGIKTGFEEEMDWSEFSWEKVEAKIGELEGILRTDGRTIISMIERTLLELRRNRGYRYQMVIKLLDDEVVCEPSMIDEDFTQVIGYGEEANLEDEGVWWEHSGDSGAITVILDCVKLKKRAREDIKSMIVAAGMKYVEERFKEDKSLVLEVGIDWENGELRKLCSDLSTVVSVHIDDTFEAQETLILKRK